MKRSLITIFIMLILLVSFLAFVNIGSFKVIEGVSYGETWVLILTIILLVPVLLLSNVFITYMCVLSVSDEFFKIKDYVKEKRKKKLEERKDDFDPHADYH